ncbi:hypothetical protein XENOCAPTIV_018570 [Xenoophorus captivus]|uniref:Uncharacterized protein n=1 Tax=Xenoophorus captivus TaxID=1517983 RepID=A0ABV0RAS8_9TELE
MMIHTLFLLKAPEPDSWHQPDYLSLFFLKQPQAPGRRGTEQDEGTESPPTQTHCHPQPCRVSLGSGPSIGPGPATTTQMGGANPQNLQHAGRYHCCGELVGTKVEREHCISSWRAIPQEV